MKLGLSAILAFPLILIGSAMIGCYCGKSSLFAPEKLRVFQYIENEPPTTHLALFERTLPGEHSEDLSQFLTESLLKSADSTYARHKHSLAPFAAVLPNEEEPYSLDITNLRDRNVLPS